MEVLMRLLIRIRHLLTPWRAATLVIVALTLTILRLSYSSTQASPAPCASTVLSPSSEPRVAIVTFTTKELSYTHLSLKNKQAYARRHNYDFVVDFEPTNKRGLMWHKLVMLEQIIEAGQHDWVWWIDFDTLITNTSIKLTDIAVESLTESPDPEQVDFLLTPDCFPLNAGSMLLRAHPRTLEILNNVRSYGDAHPDLNEQDCLRDLIDLNQHGEDRRILMIPQWKINAFPEEIRCWQEINRFWKPGMFVLHFAGAWAHVKEEDPTGFLMRKYESFIDL